MVVGRGEKVVIFFIFPKLRKCGMWVKIGQKSVGIDDQIEGLSSIAYADDLTLSVATTSARDSQPTLQSALDAISQWCGTTNMIVNVGKTQGNLVTSVDKNASPRIVPPDLTYNDEPVSFRDPETDSLQTLARLLGCTFSNRGIGTPQAALARSKALASSARTCHIFSRLAPHATFATTNATDESSSSSIRSFRTSAVSCALATTKDALAWIGLPVDTPHDPTHADLGSMGILVGQSANMPNTPGTQTRSLSTRTT